jgi:hypothetical protein
VKSASEWEFSSFSEYADIRSGSLPSMELVRSMIDSDEEYHSFLTEGNLPLIPELRALMLDE